VRRELHKPLTFRFGVPGDRLEVTARPRGGVWIEVGNDRGAAQGFEWNSITVPRRKIRELIKFFERAW
jgi:hypothetical protein